LSQTQLKFQFGIRTFLTTVGPPTIEPLGHAPDATSSWACGSVQKVPHSMIFYLKMCL